MRFSRSSDSRLSATQGETMATQSDALTEATAGPPGGPGPRITLQVLRVVAVLHSLVFLAQPVVAGDYLMGDVDALALHEANSFVITLFDVVQLGCAIAFFWKGRGRAWPIWASLAIAIAVEVQIGMGYERMLVVHLPLGVSLAVGQVLTTVWLFRAAAATPRPPRAPRPERAQ
jgi:hypothetical protein